MLEQAVLFATDIAARGLDFPAVDWVIQVDCPEDVNTYIHRVGRTARYNAGGRGLLMLLPSEAKMIELLEEVRLVLARSPVPRQAPTETRVVPYDSAKSHWFRSRSIRSAPSRCARISRRCSRRTASSSTSRRRPSSRTCAPCTSTPTRCASRVLLLLPLLLCCSRSCSVW